MSDPYRLIREKLSEIDELCTAAGKKRDDVINLRRLSLSTGLTEAEIELLLLGEALPEASRDEMIRERVRFLYREHTDAHGNPRSISEIAQYLGATDVWVNRLVAGQSKPSITHGAALCELYKVHDRFITDPPAQALARELGAILVDLKIEVRPQAALEELGVRHVSRRTTHPDPDLTALAQMVASIAKQLGTVQKDLQRRLDTQESER